MTKSLSFLRPYLDARCQSPSLRASVAHFRFYSTLKTTKPTESVQEWRRKLLNGEVAVPKDLYPRCQLEHRRPSTTWLRETFGHLGPDAFEPETTTTICGRVTAHRSAGKGLTFLTVGSRAESFQIVCNYSRMHLAPEFKTYQDAIRQIAKGDIYEFNGHPYRSSSGELSILLKTLPRRLSLCIHPFVDSVSNPETKIRNRHVEMWTSQQMTDTIRLRSHIIKYIRDFLVESDHIEVQTPILASEAGGAVARPFHTVATEFRGRPISLRIAPELWLKRLVLGGFERVFEIGPCFRNEGLDTHHNPEFTSCEFYQAYSTLEDLITTTERLIQGLDNLSRDFASKPETSLPIPDFSSTVPYSRLDFISTIESCLNRSLPDLRSPEATDDLLAIFKDHDISTPANPSLPRLLDKLSSTFIEPRCQAPTFITHHPECLSPLAKSFTHPQTGQMVAASAELFMKGQEIANMYEEENSPFEQRRKFEEALTYRDDHQASLNGMPRNDEINESYLEALEWGLPPTGGWGCGIDRLVMLFSGASRIGDVLTFGTLRNVVNLASVAKPVKKPGQVAQKATNPKLE